VITFIPGMFNNIVLTIIGIKNKYN